MKLPFSTSAPLRERRQPITSVVPALKTVDLAAHYRAARVGGDFYDFLQVVEGKLLFVLLDIAGKRESALHSAAIAQELFRKRGSEMFTSEMEDSSAITQLTLEMNRAIISTAGGVCHAPAFLGCYDENIGVLSYINAGHTPAVLRDQQGTLLLEANGLPLGLFSHSTHDAQFCALGPGAALVLVSKGLVETKNAGQEFGITGVQRILEKDALNSANEICHALLNAVASHEKKPSVFGPSLNFAGIGSQEPNDITTLAMVRKDVAQHAIAS